MNRFAFLLLAVTCSITALGQRFQPLTGPVPRTADGKPDLSGVWEHPFVPDMTKDAPNQKGTAELPFTEWGASEWKNYHPENGDYTGACLPFGLPRSVNSPYPIQIVQTSKYLALLFEQSTWFHVVPVDGRGHRKQDPIWFGDSVGHWEGDTLVVDTVNFNGHTRMDTIGHPHSDQLHLTQRFTRTDLGHISYEMIVEDLKTYTKPWKNTRTFILRPDWEIMEYSCEENNKGLWDGHIKVPKY
ncbi:MAG: hypothetical protein EXQ47_06560 [Bryobacterales bacterium]|nr:hypothetical protein [Bryobacterales bacterium]